MKSPRSGAAHDSADDYIGASTASPTEAVNAAPMRAAPAHDRGSSGVAVAGPSVGGTAAPYDPAKVEIAKEHLADSMKNLAKSSDKSEPLKSEDEPKHSITETVRAGAATAATGAAAAAAGVMSVAKKLIGRDDDDDDDMDESDYTDTHLSPTKDTTTPTTASSSTAGPPITPNSSHGLEFKGEKKLPGAADRASEKVGIVARPPSERATHGSLPGAKEPCGPLPGNLKHPTPRSSALTFGDPFGPIIVSHWNNFKYEREVSTPSSEDFEREELERTHPIPTDVKSHSIHTGSSSTNRTHGSGSVDTAVAAPIVAAALSPSDSTGIGTGTTSGKNTHPTHAPSPLKNSMQPPSAGSEDAERLDFDESDVSIRREPDIKHSTPLGGMNVDRPHDTTTQRRKSISALSVEGDPKAPENRRASIDRVGGLNVDRQKPSPTIDTSQQRRRTSGFNVDSPIEPSMHGGSGSSVPVETPGRRPSGTFNSGYNVDRPGSSKNKSSALGVDTAAKSTYHVKPKDTPESATSRQQSATVEGQYNEPTAAVAGPLSATMAAPPLNDTIPAQQGGTLAGDAHQDSHTYSGVGKVATGAAAAGLAAAGAGAAAAASSPKDSQGHTVKGAVKEAETAIKDAADTVKEKLHISSHHTQSTPSTDSHNIVPTSPAVAATYPHADAPNLTTSSATPSATITSKPSVEHAPSGDYHDVGGKDMTAQNDKSTSHAGKMAAGAAAIGASAIAAAKGVDMATKSASDDAKDKQSSLTGIDNKTTTTSTTTGSNPVSTPSKDAVGATGTITTEPTKKSTDERLQGTGNDKVGGSTTLDDKTKTHPATTGASIAAPSTTVAIPQTGIQKKPGLMAKIKNLFRKDKHKQSTSSTTTDNTTTRSDWTSTSAAVVPTSPPKLDEINISSDRLSSGYDSPHLTSSGLPKADLHATHGVPATKLDARPTSTINMSYHDPSKESRDKSISSHASLASGGASTETPAVRSAETAGNTTTTSKVTDTQPSVSGTNSQVNTATLSAPDNYQGPIPQAGPGEEVVWIKTTTTTIYNDDNAYQDDTNQDGMDDYYGRRNLGGWILDDQGGPDKGKQRISA
ncbi:hypothetical protein BGW41_001935 [Actinomortierella wolfii]|nr:hypothetical protein BGW41_001935 [Actinomortierella wolfii]